MNTCQVCDQEKPPEQLHVRASSLGAISLVYCEDCLTHGVEPFWLFLALYCECMDPSQPPKPCECPPPPASNFNEGFHDQYLHHPEKGRVRAIELMDATR